jgi:hypothetical protein
MKVFFLLCNGIIVLLMQKSMLVLVRRSGE